MTYLRPVLLSITGLSISLLLGFYLYFEWTVFYVVILIILIFSWFVLLRNFFKSKVLGRILILSVPIGFLVPVILLLILGHERLNSLSPF